MRNRSLGALLLLGAVVPFTSCGVDPALTSIVLTPSGYTALLGPCGSTQVQANFTAMGYYTRPNHAPVTRDITNSVTWYSYDTQLVTISPAGVMQVVTCANAGSTFRASTIISASAQGFHGLVSTTATVNLAEPAANVPKTTAVSSLMIVKTAGTLNSAQYVAVGKTVDGVLVPLNGKVSWSSSDPQAVRVDAVSGVARAMTAGKATVTANYTGQDGSTASGTIDFGSFAQN